MCFSWPRACRGTPFLLVAARLSSAVTLPPAGLPWQCPPGLPVSRAVLNTSALSPCSWRGGGLRCWLQLVTTHNTKKSEPLTSISVPGPSFRAIQASPHFSSHRPQKWGLLLSFLLKERLSWRVCFRTVSTRKTKKGQGAVPAEGRKLQDR